jgi:uncharacterized damage-inducible protein DinB
MDAAFVELLRHNAWANDAILAACEGLPEDRLEYVTQGTFGGLGATLRHIVEAEERYVRGLRGQSGAGPDPAGGYDRPSPPEALAPSVRVLRGRAKASGDELVALAAAFDAAAIVDSLHRGESTRVRAVTFFMQALDHGAEHRTQVRLALTMLGYEPPDVDAWSYEEHVLGPIAE